MADRRTALVLGGGVGGLVAANRLRHRLPREDRVVLIDREQYHLFQASLLWLMVGQRRTEQIRRPLDPLRNKGIEVIRGAIEHIDPGARAVLVGGRRLTGDALVISLGAALAPDQIPGLAAGGHNFYTLDGTKALRDTLRQFRGGRIVLVTATPAYKCPAAPYEAALLIECECRRRGIRHRVQMELYAAEPGPMGVAGPAVSTAVRQLIEQRDIRYYPAHQVSAVDVASRRISFSNGAEAGYDLLAYVPPHRAPAAVRESGLAGDSGWIAIDRHTMETSFPSVFAIGDVTGIPLKLGKPLPKAGVFAHGQAEVVAQNLAHAWTGRGKPARFDGYGSCFIETGDGRAGFGSGNFYAEPTPQIKLRSPSRWWHLGKVLFERRWLRRWF